MLLNLVHKNKYINKNNENINIIHNNEVSKVITIVVSNNVFPVYYSPINKFR